MKRDSSHDKGMPLSRQFIRSLSDSRNLRLPGDLLLDKQAAVRARRIFVVKQTRWLPPTPLTAGKRVKLILVFDNDPDSLRLVFGLRASRFTCPPFYLSDAQGTPSSVVALLWILVVGLMAMFLPLY
jgi:hypothetical protein